MVLFPSHDEDRKAAWQARENLKMQHKICTIHFS